MSAAPPASQEPSIVPLGDGAVTIVLGDSVDLALNRRVHALAQRVRAAAIPGVTDVVPAYATLAVYYDQLYLDAPAIEDALRALLTSDVRAENAGAASEHVLAVRYDGEDLEEVARRTGLSAEEVVARHTARTYTVFLLGFAPGFAYLGELDPRLELERRAEPRLRVPAGSVAIAGRQTAVYPRESPGGWHLIGHTDMVLFDVAQPASPALLAPGDRVRFVASAR